LDQAVTISTSRRLKVVHIGKFYPPDLGGIESVTATLAESTSTAGHYTTVVCIGNLNSTEKSIGGVSIFRTKLLAQFASQPLSFKYLILSISRAWKADIVHFHAPNMLGAMAVLLMRRKSSLVVHWHSDVCNKGWLGLLFRPLELALLQRADRIIATSRLYAEYSSLLKIHFHKVSIVPIGIKDITTSSGSNVQLPESIRQVLGSRSLLLSVGRLVPYKGFRVLIDAAKQMPNTLVVIVGMGPLHRELAMAVESSGMQKQVLLTGNLDKFTLHALFLHASLFCLPSVDRAEAFGVVLIEAMSYGLPIVATNIPGSGVSWVNLHGTSGLNVAVNNSKELAETCNKIMSNSVLREELSRGARQRYLSHFSEQKFVSKVLDIYEKLRT